MAESLKFEGYKKYLEDGNMLYYSHKKNPSLKTLPFAQASQYNLALMFKHKKTDRWGCKMILYKITSMMHGYSL